jgi:two-component system sensor histidine kinase BarA
VKRLGIKYQILLTTLVPALLLGGFFTYSHVSESIALENELMQHRGRIIAQQIAGSVGSYLSSGNRAEVQRLLERSVSSDGILLAAVYDREGERIASSPPGDMHADEPPDYHYFRESIMPPGGTDSNADRQGWVNLYLSRLPLERKATLILIESGLLFVSVLIVTVLLTLAISRRITRPVSRLMEHLRDVETGELGKAIEPVEANEIGALQKGFNRMTRSLLANRRHLNIRIQQATQQLNEAITDLEAKNRELGFARDLAQDANRSKSEFLANMSHEIRTPINGIKGFINLLGQSRLDPVQRRYVDIITKSTGDLTSIVDEILDFSKMESGKLHIVDEVFDLHEVIEQTRDILFINALAKEIDLNLVIFSDTPQRVVGDKLRLKQILLNLIGNAIKFTDRGRVVIRVWLEDLEAERAQIAISVEDSGIGISEQDQQSLFQAFSQVENADARRSSGTGLGLVISKNLATLMGGSIELQSTIGKGSRFDLRLPFRLAQQLAPAASDETDAARALIFAAEQTNLMEIRTLFDRAGVSTEAELVDPSEGIEPILASVQRNLAYIDLLVFDLRRFDVDLDSLLARINADAVRIIVMHYDPGHQLPTRPAHVEYLSIINTSRRIAQLVYQREADGDDVGDEAQSAPVERKKVLLVDDNQVNLRLASELIRLWGHEVREAENAERAMEIYREQKFDLIVLDIQMPDIDGVSLLHMMREYDPDDRTPVAALTANVLNREADRLLELGFDFFLGKPIDEDRFRALLDGRAQQQGASQQPAVAASNECSLDYASSLKLAAGNESLLRQILQILRRDIPEQRQHLRDAFDRLDCDRLGALAHKLHGVTCYAGLPRLRRVVIAFQQQLGTQAPDSLAALVEELDAELTAVEREVDGYLQRLAEKA